jgi:DNA adenine methylase
MLSFTERKALFHEARIGLALTHDPLAFFLLNRYACNAIVSQNRKDYASFGSVFNHDGMDTITRAKLLELKQFLIRSKITNLDYSALIDAPGKDVFLIIDPPYTIITHQSAIYQYAFSKREHEFLAERLRATKHQWLLTIHSHKRVFDLYKDFNFSHRRYCCTMPHRAKNNNRAREELWITNY